MFVSSLFIPVIVLLAGWLMWKHYPKEINWILGYRTKRSTKNIRTWKFANQYCGKLWVIVSVIMILPSLIVWLIFHSGTHGEGAITVLIVIQCVISIIPIFLTESALKDKFG